MQTSDATGITFTTSESMALVLGLWGEALIQAPGSSGRVGASGLRGCGGTVIGFATLSQQHLVDAQETLVGGGVRSAY